MRAGEVGGGARPRAGDALRLGRFSLPRLGPRATSPAAARAALAAALFAAALLALGSGLAGSHLPAAVRWLLAALLLSAAALLAGELATRRARAEERAHRFLALAGDMLCTADAGGHFVELNSTWQRVLGYTPAELRAHPWAELVHPEDRERARAEVEALFGGAGAAGFDCRYGAKDGTWRWLRWSAHHSASDNLVYARATDITELKRVEAEREDLLDEVRSTARHDPLTGLPNRRLLDERLPQEMARARRALSPLCLALLDLDRFRAYNDAHGHPAGDAVLRECAAAWDAELRGEDTLVRIGGEEFLVLLPNCTPVQAAAIVERLRAVTPEGHTCSAGLACWDLVESGADLIGRADNALYAAKQGGGDRLVESPGME